MLTTINGYTVRRVLRKEYSKYRAHLKALDENSKYLRFGFPVKDEMIDTLCDKFENNPAEHILFGVEDDNLNLIAIGHVSLSGKMELAFSVLKEYQGKGIGDALMKRCIRYCRTHNILEGYMVCLSQNGAIKHLCTKNNIQMQSECGEVEGDIQLADPTMGTYVKEGIAMNAGAFDYASKRVLRHLTILTKRIDKIRK